ncbi:MAG TPA: TRAP transporter small permease [Ramlibacter sp.]|nr:TRAP transporter small permease [Ramlibacter sp.]
MDGIILPQEKAASAPLCLLHRTLLGADRLCLWLGKIALVMSGVCLIIASMVGAVDVLATAFFHLPLPLTVELSSYLLPLIVFGALAHAQQRHEHVSVDLVTQSLPQKLQAMLRFVGLVGGLALFVLLAWRSGALFLDSFEEGETASAVYAFTVWPFKLAVFVALVVVALEFLRQIAWTLAGREWIPEPSGTKEFHE